MNTISWNRRAVFLVGSISTVFFILIYFTRSLKLSGAHGVPSGAKLLHEYRDVDKQSHQNDKKVPAFGKRALKLPDANQVKDHRIPNIIHQIWDTHLVPKVFDFWIQSCVTKHPDWQYWFWTERDIKIFLKKYYPAILKTYLSYPNMLYRADVARYVIMYHYGGMYLDLDMKCLKPVTQIASRHACVLSEETHEHAYLLNKRNVSNIFNSVLLCRTRHPLFKLAMDHLPTYRPEMDAVYATGPMFLDRMYNSLNKGGKPEVVVLHPKYFLSTYDDAEEPRILKACRDYKQLTPAQVSICKGIIARDVKNTPHPDALMAHMWIHVITFEPSWKTRNTINVTGLVSKLQSPAHFIR